MSFQQDALCPTRSTARSAARSIALACTALFTATAAAQSCRSVASPPFAAALPPHGYTNVHLLKRSPRLPCRLGDPCSLTLRDVTAAVTVTLSATAAAQRWIACISPFVTLCPS